MDRTKEVSMDMIAAIEARLAALEALAAKSKGTASTREMTDDDARRIMKGGDLETVSHKAAAETLGLSYGQVYSARGGYTFKHIAKEVGHKA